MERVKVIFEPIPESEKFSRTCVDFNWPTHLLVCAAYWQGRVGLVVLAFCEFGTKKPFRRGQ